MSDLNFLCSLLPSLSADFNLPLVFKHFCPQLHIPIMNGSEHGINLYWTVWII